MASFESEEKNPEGNPLVTGALLDFADFDEDTEKFQLAMVKEMQKIAGAKPPYMIVYLAMPEDIKLIMDPPLGPAKEGVFNPVLKLMLPASQIVDLSAISNPGNSVVKTNPCLPIFRWFQAANLLLAHMGQKGRVIPFPLDQEEGETVFHMLRVTPQEFVKYDEILKFATTNQGVDEGFLTASRFSYEVLKMRGTKELTANMVDTSITHVMLNSNASMRGVMLYNADRETLSDPEFEKSHFIYY